MSIQTINLLLVVVEQMRIIYLSTRSVTYSDPGMRYVARLHDRYLGKKSQTKESVCLYIPQRKYKARALSLFLTV